MRKRQGNRKRGKSEKEILVFADFPHKWLQYLGLKPGAGNSIWVCCLGDGPSAWTIFCCSLRQITLAEAELEAEELVPESQCETGCCHHKQWFNLMCYNARPNFDICFESFVVLSSKLFLIFQLLRITTRGQSQNKNNFIAVACWYP